MRTAEWLKNQRVKHSLTQSQLANKIGISKFAIENIEQGRRMGSAETWEKIENYFENGETVKLSYDSSEIIEELKEDILEFGEDNPCILVYKVIDNHIFFTNYDFITEKDPFDPAKELEKDERYIETTFIYALEVLESQNKLIHKKTS